MSADITGALDTYIGLYTTGLMDVTTGGSLGSGTFARYGRLRGVLTCAHVLAAIEALAGARKKFQIGFLCFPVRNQRQQRSIPHSYTDEVRMHGTAAPWRGPDIGFLKLPEVFASELESIASFVNLEAQLDDYLTKPKNQNALEVVSGIVAEMSPTPLGTPPTTPTTMAMEGLMNVGKSANRSPVRSEDRLYFRPIPGPGFVLPQSYKGTSGGGLWRIGIKASDTAPVAYFDRRLIGTAYYQTPRGKIICHGPRSIYEDLMREMRAKWPSDCPAAMPYSPP